MKLERVVLSNFLSHGSTDWAPDGARLVTLVGANGSGKSTLASDALRYALFDVARAKTDELVSLGATDMSVVVEFGFAGARYRVARGRTTKSGGRSFLELHVAEGDGWRPLTGDTIRDTQLLIGELLRLDPETFETAVLLGQGEANRFAEATAGQRKAILGQVLGLEVYARAETRARELARDVEARTSAERASYDRIEAAIAELGDVDEVLETAQLGVAGCEAELTLQRSARNDVDARIRELDAKLLAAAALGEEITRLEAEHTELAESWKAAHGRVMIGRGAVEEAERIVAAAADVDQAAEQLPALRAEVDRLVALEAEDRRLAGELETARVRIEELTLEHRHLVDAWHNLTGRLAARIATLEEEGKHAEQIRCPKCGAMFAAGQERILAAIHDARVELKVAGAEPKEPVRLATEKASRVRLESRIREAGHDPGALAKLNRELTDLAAIAARAEGLEQARATIAREAKAVTEAEAEKTRLTEKGQALTVRLNDARVRAAEVEPLRVRRSAVAAELLAVDSSIKQLERGAQIGQQLVARAEANVERRDQLATERDALDELMNRSTSELDLLRRLVAAFGPTGIPARIIEGVLPELGRYANELLADLRPGMALELRAQRAKKSGDGIVEALDLVVRDDVGERGLALFSGGERMSVSLALAVGLSRLVARRAGTAIRTLVIDEPDGLDTDARRAFGQALRILAHHGELERVVLVSHHPDLADVGDAVYQVTKNGAGSVVERIA